MRQDCDLCESSDIRYCVSHAGEGVSGADEEITLSPASEAIGAASPTAKRFPFLVGCTALELPTNITSDPDKVQSLPEPGLLLGMGAPGAFPDEVVSWKIQPRASAKPLYEVIQHATVQVQAQLVLSVEEHDGTPVDATGEPSFAQSY